MKTDSEKDRVTQNTLQMNGVGNNHIGENTNEIKGKESIAR